MSNRFLLLAGGLLLLVVFRGTVAAQQKAQTLNQQADGYRGIWYMNQPSGDEYVYKYSGGLGTYCAKHKPFAVYCRSVNKTFFCYGGATETDNRQLLHMVSCFDHQTGMVPRPTILLDKQTNDAHDNPVITVDDRGFIWIFSTSHGRARPSFIHRSKKPYDIRQFVLVKATRREASRELPIDNFSYLQVWHQTPGGFAAFFTRYNDPAKRTLMYMRSEDGVRWSPWQRLAAVEEGHYQVSGQGAGKIATMFNYHPRGKGLNWRTNLYYLESLDRGASWQTVAGQPVKVPIQSADHVSLVRDYKSRGLNVYLKDLRFDTQDRPVMLFLTSKGFESGPQNNPRNWMLARWNGESWIFTKVTTSDNNYDMGSLWIENENDWWIIAPTLRGPQAFNPGGEVAMWNSTDSGATWTQTNQLTSGSERNHTYVRRPVNAHPDFFAIWADGHGREPSSSNLYFSNRAGEVFALPRKMENEFAKPEKQNFVHAKQ